MPRLTFARPVQLPQRPLKTLNLTLVIDFLPLSEFQRFQHFLHFIERTLQFLNDSIHLLNRIRDGGSLVRGFRLLALLRHLAGLTWFPGFARFTLLTRAGPFSRLGFLASFTLLGFLDGGRGRFRGGRGWNRFGGRRQRATRFATPRMASTAASGTTPASGCCIWLFGSGFLCFVRRHRDRLPTGN
jgi:hypothetical protein